MTEIYICNHFSISEVDAAIKKRHVKQSVGFKDRELEKLPNIEAACLSFEIKVTSEEV